MKPSVRQWFKSPVEPDRRTLQSRRLFLANAGNGVGMLALASLLRQDGLLAAPGAPAQLPHFGGKAQTASNGKAGAG